MPDGEFRSIKTLGPGRPRPASLAQHRLEHEGEVPPRRHMVCPKENRSASCNGCEHGAVHYEGALCHRPCSSSGRACTPVKEA